MTRTLSPTTDVIPPALLSAAGFVHKKVCLADLFVEMDLLWEARLVTTATSPRMMAAHQSAKTRQLMLGLAQVIPAMPTRLRWKVVPVVAEWISFGAHSEACRSTNEWRGCRLPEAAQGPMHWKPVMFPVLQSAARCVQKKTAAIFFCIPESPASCLLHATITTSWVSKL